MSEYKFVVHYIYGEVGNEVGCHTHKQAKEIAEGIALWVKVNTDVLAEISIQDVETGEVEPYYY